MKRIALVAGVVVGLCVSAFAATEMTADQKAKLDAKIKVYQAFSTDPEFVNAVKAFNKEMPAEAKDMTQDKWKTLAVISPEVRAFSKNTLGVYMKSKKDEAIAEWFVSGENGCKVAFLSKTTSWCHKGKPKFDVPITGKTWIGEIEVDESTGVQLIQVGLPVLDGGKAIGAMVIGVSLSKL